VLVIIIPRGGHNLGLRSVCQECQNSFQVVAVLDGSARVKSRAFQDSNRRVRKACAEIARANGKQYGRITTSFGPEGSSNFTPRCWFCLELYPQRAPPKCCQRPETKVLLVPALRINAQWAPSPPGGMFAFFASLFVSPIVCKSCNLVRAGTPSGEPAWRNTTGSNHARCNPPCDCRSCGTRPPGSCSYRADAR
jgi:hypothetical protein